MQNILGKSLIKKISNKFSKFKKNLFMGKNLVFEVATRIQNIKHSDSFS